jgi:hypothetical protein
MLVEEIWEIQDKVEVVDFKLLKNYAYKKITQIYKDILENTTDRATYEQ